MRIVYLLLLLAAASFCSSCGQESTNQDLIDGAPLISETYQDDRGRSITLRRIPTKVISLAPSLTEIVFAIGAEDRLAARSIACQYPPEALDFPAVSTYPRLDFPSIAEHEPDLVLATSEIHGDQVISFFENYEIPLLFLDYEHLDDIYRHVRMLGKILRHEEEAVHLADSLEHIDRKISKATKGEVKYRVMILLGVKPLVVAGGSSYITELVSKAGGKNIFADVKEKYPKISPEAVIQYAPEYIFLPTEYDQMYQELISEYPSLALNTPATLNENVFMIEPDLVLRPGPRIMEGLKIMTRILHPRVDLTEL